ncbi:MAG: SGNH/GDSL hydrolase family protein, partial [Planctomycetota bacterium]|nr:SGNH/GDSL hydrolase family protein [Planctomycetota bacterium]
MTTKPNRHSKKRLSLSRRLQFSSAAAIGFGLVAMVALDILLLPLVMKIPRELYLMGFIAAIPGQGIKSESQGVRINSLGMTGTAPSGPKWENEIRILTLGGSVMMNRNMTERLEAKLNDASSQKVQILGAGLSGHDTRSSVIKFDYLARYDFDYVLIYHGINDLWNNHVAPDEFRIDYSHRCPWNRRNVILDNSLLCRLAFNGWPRTKPQTVVNGSGFKSAETLSKNLGDLIHKIR